MNKTYINFSLFCFVLTHSFGFSTQEFIFSVDVPVYLPYAFKASDQKELIKSEVHHFDQKCVKHSEKREKHNLYQFLESDFTPGREPYSIQDKGAKSKWRGFLKLYKPNYDVNLVTTDIRSCEGAKKIKEGQSIPNLDEEISQINKLIHLFKDESFGFNTEESREQFSKKMQLNILLNRMRSISSTRNKSLKRYTDDLDKDGSVLIMRAFWEPKWVKRGNSVSFKEVRHFFLEYLRRDPDNALNFLIRQEGDILGETLGGSAHVPYRQLREAIRIHPVKISMTALLKRKNPGASLFEATHDSDLVQLRIQRDGDVLSADGLYSFYEEKIKQYITVNNCVPPLVTTGYRAAYEKKIPENLFPWLFQAIEEDRYIRQETSKVDPLMAYYAEPNCLYYVTRTMAYMPYTFLGLTKKKDPIQWDLTQINAQFEYYDPSESAIILHQMYERYSNAPVLYDASHPVMMKLPARMLLNKRSISAFNLSDLGTFDHERHVFKPATPKALKVSENISQSPFAFRDYAMTVYNQLGLVGKDYYYNRQKVERANAFFTSIFTSIFNVFDPVTVIEVNDGIDFLSTLSATSYESWVKKFKMVTDLKSGNEAIKQVLLSVNRQQTHNSQKTELEALIDSIFGTHIFEKLYRTAKALGQERFNHIYHYFIRGLVENNNRQSPLKVIEETVIEPVIKHELIEVKRELFQDVAESKEDDIQKNIVTHFQFPDFSRDIFQKSLQNIYKLLGGNKDAWTALLSIYGFNNESAFRSALNLKNKSDDTYKKQWQNAVNNLSSFCESKGWKLSDLFL